MKKSGKPKKTAPLSSSSSGENVSSIPATTFDHHKWFPWIAAAFGLILYMNTLNHQYVLDDDTVIAKNTIVTKGISAIPEIMSTSYRKGSLDMQESLYRPLSLVVFALEWQVAPNKPYVAHLVNILLYALTGFLLFKLLRKWFPSKHPFILLAVALLYLAHPLHTEVVANIKSLDEILAFLLGISALYCYHQYAEKKQTEYLFPGGLFFFLALLSKESSVTLAAVIPLAVYFFTELKEKKRYAFILASVSLGVIAYFILRKLALGGLVTFGKMNVLNNSIAATDDPVERFCTAIVFTGYYLRLFFFPHPLSFDYSFHTIPTATLSDPRFLISALSILALAAYAFLNFKKKEAAAFGILFFGITLSIVSNIFILIEASVAERFMYIPSLGLCLFIIFLLERGSRFSAKKNTAFTSLIGSNKIFFSILLFVLSAFSLKTLTRNMDWKDNFTLYSTDKEHNPDSYRTLCAYALELFNKKIFPLKDGDPQKLEYCKEDIAYLNRSLAITPDNFKAWNLLAYDHTQLKDYAQVQYAFENGLQYHREEIDLIKFYIMGINSYFFTGQYPKAIAASRTALHLDSSNAVLWNCLGMNLSEVNDRQNAFDALNHSLQLDSMQADTWYNLGNWYAKGGDFMRAINYYDKTLEKDGAHANALNNKGNCYAVMKQFDKALACYEKILKADPNNKEAIRNMAATYKNLGNTSLSMEYEKKLEGLH